MVGIVIPLFNRAELTRNCWDSIVRHTRHADLEIIFVDNGSTDETPALLRELAAAHRHRVTLLVNRENLGFARACNQGAAAARGDVIVFLNNDTLVHEGWLTPLVEELNEHPGTGVVGAKLLYPDGRIQHAGVCIDHRHIPYHIFMGAAPDDPRVNSRRSFRMVTGACMGVRKGEFLDLGGFDEGYINGHEDVDLCLRYGEAGMEVIYRPDSVVTHLESRSSGRMDHCKANTERTLTRWRGKLAQDDFNYDPDESRRREAACPA